MLLVDLHCPKCGFKTEDLLTKEEIGKTNKCPKCYSKMKIDTLKKNSHRARVND